MYSVLWIYLGGRTLQCVYVCVYVCVFLSLLPLSSFGITTERQKVSSYTRQQRRGVNKFIQI